MQPAKPLRAVVFDLDGLMFNTEELYQMVGEELLRRRGKDFPAELLHQLMGRQQRAALQMMIDWHQLSDTVDVLALETEQVFPEILDAHLALMPGLEQLLAALEVATTPKAIATSSNRAFTRNALGRFRLEPRFEFILSGEDVVRGKPDPEIYLTAARRLKVEPAEMMVLEDSQNGCRAAVAAGAYAVAVPSGQSLIHDFSGAAFSAKSLADPRIYAALQLPAPLPR